MSKYKRIKKEDFRAVNKGAFRRCYPSSPDRPGWMVAVFFVCSFQIRLFCFLNFYVISAPSLELTTLRPGVSCSSTWAGQVPCWWPVLRMVGWASSGVLGADSLPRNRKLTFSYSFSNNVIPSVPLPADGLYGPAEPVSRTEIQHVWFSLPHTFPNLDCQLPVGSCVVGVTGDMFNGYLCSRVHSLHGQAVWWVHTHWIRIYCSRDSQVWY